MSLSRRAAGLAAIAAVLIVGTAAGEAAGDQPALGREPLSQPGGTLSIRHRGAIGAEVPIINTDHSGCYAFYGRRVYTFGGNLAVDFQGGVDCPTARKHGIKMQIKIVQTKLVRPRLTGQVVAETGERAEKTTFLEGPVGTWDALKDSFLARRVRLRADLRADLTVYEDAKGNPAVWSVPPDGCQFSRGAASVGSDTAYCYWYGPEFPMRPRR